MAAVKSIRAKAATKAIKGKSKSRFQVVAKKKVRSTIRESEKKYQQTEAARAERTRRKTVREAKADQLALARQAKRDKKTIRDKQTNAQRVQQTLAARKKRQQQAAAKSLRNFRLGGARAAKQAQSHNIPISSSNVAGMGYDPSTSTMIVEFHESGRYAYRNIDPSLYDLILWGKDVPRTTGQNAYGSWTRGIGPSVGAALYWNVVVFPGRYPYRKLR